MEKMPDSGRDGARAAGTIEAFIGLLAGKSGKRATIEEMNKAAVAGWAFGAFDTNQPDMNATRSKSVLRVRT
jgi:hypothetical protein